MNRNVLVSVLSIGILALPGLASADWHTFWAQFEKDRQRNQAWPLPFNQADQHSVRSIFGSMVKKAGSNKRSFRRFISIRRPTNSMHWVKRSCVGFCRMFLGIEPLCLSRKDSIPVSPRRASSIWKMRPTGLPRMACYFKLEPPKRGPS